MANPKSEGRRPKEIRKERNTRNRRMKAARFDAVCWHKSGLEVDRFRGEGLWGINVAKARLDGSRKSTGERLSALIER